MKNMEIVSDASVLMAVILNEPERENMIKRTSECILVSPDVLPYEIGNALISLKKRRRLTDSEVLQAFILSQKIPVKLVTISIYNALKIAYLFNIYAYDAYYLQCCVENNLSLLSLDNRMCDIAGKLGIKLVGEK